MSESNMRKLLAVIYDDGIVADRVLSDLGYKLRESRMAVRGIVQRNTFKRDRAKCDMELEELGSGEVFQLSQDRGKHAGGCRLDREAIVAAATLIGRSLEDDCTLLIVNKFGRSEVEGSGLRDLIADAVARDIVTIVGVPRRNLDVWQNFAGDFSDRCDVGDMQSLFAWVKARTGCEVQLVERVNTKTGEPELQTRR